MSRCNFYNPAVAWDDVVKLGVCDWQKKSLSANMCRLVLGVYSV